MARVRGSGESRQVRPALTPESNEQQMIALAMDLVKKRLIEGTASSQETTHFLKLGTERAKLENKLLEAQAAMAEAKKNALESQQHREELYIDAIKAMKKYAGQDDYDEPDDY